MVLNLINWKGCKSISLAFFLMLFSSTLFAQHQGNTAQRVCCANLATDLAECASDDQTCRNAVNAATISGGIACTLFTGGIGLAACAVTVGAGNFAGMEYCAGENSICIQRAQGNNFQCNERIRRGGQAH